jgi:DNA invertase Pin-like site-specific DNA recombinase
LARRHNSSGAIQHGAEVAGRVASGSPAAIPIRTGNSADRWDAAKARQLRKKGITATDIAKMLGVSRATVYRYLTEDRAA